MTEQPCDWLDDYLAKDLSAERRPEFEKHIAGCGECRLAIDEWQSMCNLLKAATEQEEVPHRNLRTRIELGLTTRTTERRREVQWLRGGTLVAACVAFIVLIQFSRNPVRPVETAKRTETGVTTLTPSETLTFPDDVIGVPIDIGDPNVTVVWLYPTGPTEAASN